MRPLRLVLMLRLFLLVAIAASAVLVVEYQNAGDPAFCGVGSGCFAVRVSSYSKVGGVPLPYFGLIAYAGLLAASLIARTRDHHRFIALLSTVGGAAALVLLYLQRFVIGAICPWCFTVDIASIFVAVTAVLLALQAVKQPPSIVEVSAHLSDSKEAKSSDKGHLAEKGAPARVNPFWIATTATSGETLIWGAAAALSIALPILWGRYPVIPPTPPAIAAIQAPDKLTVIGFTDFQCPFCRKLHPEIHALESKYGDRIRYDRRMMPLSSHAGAMPAAQAYVCAKGAKREAAADFLYSAPEEGLTPTGVLAMADAIGSSREDLARCMASPETQAVIARDKGIYDSLGARGLPLTFVGSRMVIGFDPDRINRALESEIHGDRLSLKLSWLFALLGIVLAGAVVSTWRIKSRAEVEAQVDV